MALTVLRRLGVAALLLVFVLTSACTVRTADLTVATSRLVELDRVDLDTLPTKRRIVGKDTKFIPLFFAFPALQPNLESAVDDALNKGEGDLLTDAVVKIRNLWVLLGFVATLSVEADVVDTRQRP